MDSMAVCFFFALLRFGYAFWLPQEGNRILKGGDSPKVPPIFPMESFGFRTPSPLNTTPFKNPTTGVGQGLNPWEL